MSTPHPVIAIDGTAASGKSTVARELGARLGYVYVNTGLMYRAVTWWMLDRGVPTGDAALVAKALEGVRLKLWLEGETTRLTMAEADPMPHVRDGRVNEHVSAISGVPEVRELLVARQRGLRTEAPLVMEGRDIGTVVFPETPFKYYIDADPSVRAARRRAQGETDAIAERDRLDSTRAASPLRAAEGALRLDSGQHSAEQIVLLVLEDLAAKGLRRAEQALAEPVES
ncbi:MAG: (d)CMP kinase [Verrucomicrobiota bacterium]